MPTGRLQQTLQCYSPGAGSSLQHQKPVSLRDVLRHSLPINRSYIGDMNVDVHRGAVKFNLLESSVRSGSPVLWLSVA